MQRLGQDQQGEPHHGQMASGAEVLHENMHQVSWSDTVRVELDVAAAEEGLATDSGTGAAVGHTVQPAAVELQSQRLPKRSKQSMKALVQTRLHTLVKKVPGAIEFSKQVSRRAVPLQDRLFDQGDGNTGSGATSSK
jgi:hypothetical protein